MNGSDTAFAPLALVGIGCLFPKANGAGHYWANVKRAADGIGPVPASHWNPADYFDSDPKSPDMTYAQRGGFLDPVDFNPLEYGIAPRDLEATDTTQLLGLVAAKKALEDAKIAPARDGFGEPNADGARKVDRSRISVILGVTGTLELVIPLGARLGHPKWKRAMRDAGVPEDRIEDAAARIAESYVPWQENSFPGLLGNVVAGRIANRLDLGGTNCVVDAACASSLSAVHLAALELQAGRCDVAVTGGADTFNDIFMFMCFSKTPALSPSGDARPFDANGDGTILGEGIGVVVLKRLADAERDGDRVYAVIKGIGSSSDGKGNAIYAPSAAGQKACLETTYKLAGVSPGTVELVEAHGTGTKVGDAVEASALAAVYAADAPADKAKPWCAVGSVKSQIGHTKAAAGAASLIKAALSLYNKVLPPTAKVKDPVDPLKPADGPLYVNASARPWLPRPNHPRRAAMSAFGFGGSNFHAVLEEHRPEKLTPDWGGDVEIVPLVGETAADLLKQLDDLPTAWAEWQRVGEASRAGFRADAPRRLVLVAGRDVTDLAKLAAAAKAKLAAEPDAQRWSLPEGAFFGAGPAPRLAVLFPGQGSQSVGMGRDAATTFPELLETLALADAAFDAPAGEPRLSDRVYPPTDYRPDARQLQEAALRSTDAAQPALGALGFGLWRVLSERFGVAASAFLGHSYGELVALAAAGRLTPEELFRLSARRGKLMAECGKVGDAGGMLAVFAPLEQIEAVIESDKLSVGVANKNAPSQTVLSGPADAIEAAEKAFAGRGVRVARLPVAAAFHSPLVAAAAEPFAAALADAGFPAGSAPVVANTTAKAYPDSPDEARALLGRQLAEPVAFADGVRELYALGARQFVEVGPGGVLARLAVETLQSAGRAAETELFSLQSGAGRKGGLLELAEGLARLAAAGHPVRLEAWEANSLCRPAKPGKPGHTVALTGANYVAPRPARPAAPKPAPVPRSTSVGPAPMSAPRPAPSDPTALAVTHQTLAALQQMQEQTAELHRRFLETQQQAQQTLFALVAQQQAALFPGAALPTLIPVPAPAAPKPADYAADLAPAPTRPIPASATVRQAAFAPTPVNEPPAPRPPAPKPAPVKSASPARQHVEAVLMEVVAEKTGYPASMLEPGMSLDADLGVDSIKRVEILSAIQEKLPSAPVVKPEHLGTLHTLKDVAEFLANGTTVLTDEPSGKVDFAAPLPTSSSDSSIFSFGTNSAPASAEAERVLMEVVAEKTGYPASMLEPGMSLDADLGVDSIKRVEILSAIQEKLPSAPVVKPEHLGTLHTLKDVAEFLAGNNKSTHSTAKLIDGPPPTSIVTTEPVDLSGLSPFPDGTHPINLANGSGSRSSASRREPPRAPFDPAMLEGPPSKAGSLALDKVDRSVVQVLDLDGANRPRLPLAQGAEVWVVADDEPLAAELVDRFQEAGATARRVAWDGADAAAGSPAGLVLLAPERAGERPVNHWAFRWIQKASPTLRRPARNSGAPFLLTVARLDGAFGFGDLATESDVTAGGLAGLAKTARHEWPEVACKAVDLHPEFARSKPADAAAALLDEATAAGPPEVGVSAGHRCTLELARVVRRPGADAAPLLGPSDVIVVTGGARGVTAEAACALAESFQCALVLTGRTAAPTGPEPDWLRHAADDAAIKKAVAEQLGAQATPRVVGEQASRYAAQREITRTLDRVRAAGGRAAYHAVDITDGAAVAKALAEAQSALGEVTGVVHGAGVLADRRIEDLTPEKFDAVYATKVRGLDGVMKALAGHPLKVLALFSSTTARLGRVGQAAYACANEVLNKRAQLESRRRPGARVVAVNWGPWDGGMVTPSLRRVFESEGVGLIPMTEGGLFLSQELTAAGKAVEVVALGKPPRGKVGSGGVPPPAPAVGAAAPTVAGPGSSATLLPELDPAFDRTLDIAAHPVLRSHVLDGRAVLPMALHMEWLAHAALHGNPGLVFHGFNDLRITHGVMVEEAAPAQLKVLAGKARKSEGLFHVPVELRGRRKDGRDAIHSRAEVVLAAALPPAPTADRLPDVQPYPHPVPEVYRYFLFHGTALQGIERVEGMADAAFVGTSYPAPPPAEWFAAPLRTTWVADPMVLDVAFQFMILWSFAQHGSGSLPCFAGRYRQYRRAFPIGPTRIAVRVRRDNGSFARADLDFLDADGQLVARMQDYECVIDRQLDQAFRRNQLAPKVRQ